jgi:hypothetical protein
MMRTIIMTISVAMLFLGGMMDVAVRAETCQECFDSDACTKDNNYLECIKTPGKSVDDCKTEMCQFDGGPCSGACSSSIEPPHR